MNDTPTPAQPLVVCRRWPRRLWRIAKWSFALLTLVCVVLLCVRWYKIDKAEKELAAVVAETDEIDPHWRFEGVFLNRPPLEDKNNAAFAVLEMKKQLPADWPKKHKFRRFDAELGVVIPQDKHLLELIRLHETPERLHDDELQCLRSELASARNALTAARQLKNFSECRFPVEWDRWPASDVFGESMNASKELRTAVHLLQLDAELACEENRPGDAFECLLGMINAGPADSDEPFLILMLIRIANQLTALQSLARSLGSLELTDSQLGELMDRLETARSVDRLIPVMRGDRAVGFASIMDVIEGRRTFEPDGRKPVERTFWQRLSFWGWEKVLAIECAAIYLKSMNRFIEILKLPRPHRVEKSAALVRELKENFPGSFAHGPVFAAIGALEKMEEVHSRWHAELLCTRVGLAVERFRLEHNRWPDSLEQLCAKYLKAVPDDPFSRAGPEPVRLLRTDDGVVIYSVGTDGQDNQGYRSKDNFTTPGNDVIFRLYDPDKRRQAPPALEKE